uniref:Uncharacterized protein n=1 Tax=Caenorhabditis japonica TaxID=281687 RepID=A0A8R1IS36_CAEJA
MLKHLQRSQCNKRKILIVTVGVCCVILLASISTLVFVTVSLYWHNYKSKKLGNLTFSPTDHGRSRLAFTTALFVTFCFVELVPTGLLVGFEDCE